LALKPFLAKKNDTLVPKNIIIHIFISYIIIYVLLMRPIIHIKH
jgi:hypothetical protein